MQGSCKNTSLLVMACLNGYLDVASYLIEKCHADIEEVCSVTIDGETIDGATPLWCAAAAGHLNLVKLLVSYGASKNNTTKTKSTPLRAACFEGYSEIIRYLVQQGADIEIANWLGHTCLMIACYKGHYEISKYLLECGANINREDNGGKTALYECVESSNLDLVKLLLKPGTKLKGDFYGITPLMKAASDGKAKIVEYFIEELPCTKEERVNALELLGAALIDIQDTAMGLDYLRRAMKLRFENSECPLEKPVTYSALASYVNETEACTSEEFEKITSDPHKLNIQALLVRERILGLAHPDTIFYVRHRAAKYADNEDFGHCIKLYAFSFGLCQKVYKPFSKNTYFDVLFISDIFTHISENVSHAKGLEHYFSYILQHFELTLKEIETAMRLSREQDQELNDTTQFHHTLIIAFQTLNLMCYLQPSLNETQKSKLKTAVIKLVHINPRSKNGSLFKFLSCFKNRTKDARFSLLPYPSSEVIDLLSETGACSNVVS